MIALVLHFFFCVFGRWGQRIVNHLPGIWNHSSNYKWHNGGNQDKADLHVSPEIKELK